MQATQIGQRVTVWGKVETMLRLSRPLPDRAPDVRNVVLWADADGRQSLLGGAAYERQDGTWAPVPRGSWVRCFATFTPAEVALVEAETGLTLTIAREG